MADLDLSEVFDFEAELRRAADRVMPKVAPVIKKGALNIKKAMKDDATGHKSLKDLPRTISFEMDSGPTWVEAEIGWLKPTGQGHLENIAAFGTSKQAPVMDITRGLRAEERPLVDWLLRVGVEVIG